MVVVAITGILCGGEIMRRRRAYFLAKARVSGQSSRSFSAGEASALRWVSQSRAWSAAMRRDRERFAVVRSMYQTSVPASDDPQGGVEYVYRSLEKSLMGMVRTAELCGRLANHHTRLEEKYARAARYPWLPVAPDPPEPK